MDEVRQDGRVVRKALMVAMVLGVALSPFFYHLVPFLLVPILIPIVIIFLFVFFTGLTDFEQKRMVILNIILPVFVIGIYELYLYFAISSGTHSDIHLSITVWLVQILAANLLLILYFSIKSLRKRKKLEEEAQIQDQVLPRDI